MLTNAYPPHTLGKRVTEFVDGWHRVYCGISLIETFTRHENGDLVTSSLWTGRNGRSAETDAGPSFASPRRDASPPSAREAFFTAWATLSKCLVHIKADADVDECIQNIPSVRGPSPHLLAKPGERKIRRAGEGDGA